MLHNRLTHPVVFTTRRRFNISQFLFKIIPPGLHARLTRYLDYVRQAIPSWVTMLQRIITGLNVDSLIHFLKTDLEKLTPDAVGAHILTLYEGYVASLGFKTVDIYLREEAKALGKVVGGIEEIEDQCNDTLGTDLGIARLNASLKTMEDLRMGVINESPLQKLIKSYRQGSIEPGMLWQEGTEHEFEQLQKRNKKMAARIINLLRGSPDSYFFAFGTLHFIGKDNIPDILRSAGFEVEQVQRSTSDSVVPKPTHFMVVGLILSLRL